MDSPPRPRWRGWPRSIDHLLCPGGHPIAKEEISKIGEWGVLPCRWSAPDPELPGGHGPECGRRLFLVFLPRRAKTPDGSPLKLLFACEVESREIAYMEQAGMDADEMLRFLDAYEPPRDPRALTSHERRVLALREVDRHAALERQQQHPQQQQHEQPKRHHHHHRRKV